MQNSAEKMKKIGNSFSIREKMLTIFGWHFEIAELCKGVHFVDLGESFQAHIFLQNFVSIQPRTSLAKFAEGRSGFASGGYRLDTVHAATAFVNFAN